MNPKLATDEVKLAYLVGVASGLDMNKSRIGKKKIEELKKHAGTAAECVFNKGTFRGPLVVMYALNYFDRTIFESIP